MKLVLKHLLFFSAAFLLTTQAAWSAGQADTIDELVKMFDDSECRPCHTEIYDQWKDSWHANTINSSLKGMRNFIKIGLKEEWNRPLTKAEVLKCLDCHAPAVNFASDELAVEIGEMIVTAFEENDMSKAESVKKELARLNVGCIACHNLKATSISMGLRGEPKPGAVYGVHGKTSPGHETIKSAELNTSLFCMQCHGIYSAPDGEKIQCNTLSGSFQDAYSNLGGSQSCQDCHMRKNDRGHSFPGGHDLEIVKEGIDFNIQVTTYKHLPGQVPGVTDNDAWVPSAVLTAFITNRAGHRIPDG